MNIDNRMCHMFLLNMVFGDKKTSKGYSGRMKFYRVYTEDQTVLVFFSSPSPSFLPTTLQCAMIYYHYGFTKGDIIGTRTLSRLYPSSTYGFSSFLTSIPYSLEGNKYRKETCLVINFLHEGYSQFGLL